MAHCSLVGVPMDCQSKNKRAGITKKARRESSCERGRDSVRGTKVKGSESID